MSWHPRKGEKLHLVLLLKKHFFVGFREGSSSGENAFGVRQANVGFCSFLLYVH